MAARVRKSKAVPVAGLGPVRVVEVAVLASWDQSSGLVLWALRVELEVDGAVSRFRVVVPSAVPFELGAWVELLGVRVEFVTRAGRCRPVVRADAVREVVSGVRAA